MSLNVSDHRRVDLDAKIVSHEYFAKIVEQQENGGRAAFLYDMLTMDLSDFNVRAVPITDALREQQALSLTGFDAWWMEVLTRGYVLESKYGLETEFHKWMPFVAYGLLYESYKRWVSGQRREQLMPQNAMIRYFGEVGYAKGRHRVPLGEGPLPGIGGGRVLWPAKQKGMWGFQFDGLDVARNKFDDKVRISKLETNDYEDDDMDVAMKRPDEIDEDAPDEVERLDDGDF